MFLYLSGNVQYFLVKFYRYVLHVTLMVTKLETFPPSYPLCWGSFWGTFGSILSMFLHVSISSQNFLMMFCAELLGTTLMVTKQKNMLGHLLSGHLGQFWSILEYVSLVLRSNIILAL